MVSRNKRHLSDQDGLGSEYSEGSAIFEKNARHNNRLQIRSGSSGRLGSKLLTRNNKGSSIQNLIRASSGHRRIEKSESSSEDGANSSGDSSGSKSKSESENRQKRKSSRASSSEDSQSENQQRRLSKRDPSSLKQKALENSANKNQLKCPHCFSEVQLADMLQVNGSERSRSQKLEKNLASSQFLKQFSSERRNKLLTKKSALKVSSEQSESEKSSSGEKKKINARSELRRSSSRRQSATAQSKKSDKNSELKSKEALIEKINGYRKDLRNVKSEAELAKYERKYKVAEGLAKKNIVNSETLRDFKRSIRECQKNLKNAEVNKGGRRVRSKSRA